jgi:2-polyprenyl-3-methyl-5-hydroxy-6-metoxy-1,4-benzoquinol methylase
MSKYEATVDPEANTSQAVLLDLVGRRKSVLDVGCATGYLGEALIARGCTVTGIEIDRDAADEARTRLNRVVVGDLTELDLDEALGSDRFDVVLMGDVLEHMVDPSSLLVRAASLLAPGGSVVISIPNVSHGSVRLALLQGRWQYKDRGLLDRTHLRFFTRPSVEALVRDAGLRIVDMRATTSDPLGSEVEVDAAALPPGVVDWLRTQPDADVYQFVFRAVRDDGVALPDVLLAERDELRQRLADAQDVNADLARQRDAARRDIDVMRATRGWRAIEKARRLLKGPRRTGPAE